MEKELARPKYIDRIARVVCALAAVVFAFLSYFADATASPALLFWGLCGLSAAFLFLATLAPRRVRLAVVAWLPWL